MTTTLAKQPETITLKLPAAVKRLTNLQPGQRILSAFLDTSPQRMQRAAYLMAFRDGCKAIRPHLPAGESDRFEATVTRLEGYLVEGFTPKGPGVALFATAQHRPLIAVPLPRRPVLDHVTWDEYAEVSLLQAMLDDSERVAVVLFDTQHSRLFTVFLGEIESQQAFRDHVPARQATGGWFGLQQSNFARHREDHLRRHAQHTVHAVMEVLRTTAFDRMLIAGPDEPISVFEHQMPRALRSRLAGKLDLEVFATEAEVLGAALKAADDIERTEELRTVEELLDSAASPRAVVGVAGTLGALADGRVHQLVLTDGFDGTGSECPTCGRLVIDDRRCPACGLATESVTSLREAVVQRALAEDAKVEVVGGPAATRLAEYGGIGAWTRF